MILILVSVLINYNNPVFLYIVQYNILKVMTFKSF